MIRRPPRSTLFPSRRSSDLALPARLELLDVSGRRVAVREVGSLGPGPHAVRRSEEHTSELQSQSNLVCRLLLEKKKKLHPVKILPPTSLARGRVTMSRVAPA